MSSGKCYQCSINTESPQDVNRKDISIPQRPHKRCTDFTKCGTLDVGKRQPRHDTMCEGFRGGRCFIFPSRMPLYLYKPKPTSMKRGSSSSAPRLPAGSTPSHAREAPAPRPPSSHRPGGGRERQPPPLRTSPDKLPLGNHPGRSETRPRPL